MKNILWQNQLCKKIWTKINLNEIIMDKIKMLKIIMAKSTMVKLTIVLNQYGSIDYG